MKKLILLVVIAAVAAGAWYYWAGDETEVEAETPQTETKKVERGPLVMMVSTTGRVVANLDVDIKCKASGEIVKLPFDVSDVVRKGDLLVEVDPVYEDRNVKQAQISLSATQARLAQAKISLEVATKNIETERRRASAALDSASARHEDAKAKRERMKKLLEKKLASQEEYDTIDTSAIQAAADLEAAQVRMEEIKTQEKSLELKQQDVLLAEAQVESDKIALSTSQQRLTDTKVYSPIDAVVSARNVQTGQIISSGISNVGGGTSLLTLSDLTRIFILAFVDESDIGRVETGQEAEITADAFKDVQFSGRIVRIATKGLSTSNVVTFEVKIEVTSENKHLLKPEMTANVEIVAKREDDTLLVPVEAISRYGQERMLTIMKPDGKMEEIPVKTGISDGQYISVKEGISEGDTIVIQKTGGESRWRSEEFKKRMQRRGPSMMIRGGRRR